MIDLCGRWRFRPAGGEWGEIDVPAFWETQGHLELDGRATYERDVHLDDVPGFATLEVDAVADLCEVFVNDVNVGSHEVGFTPFALDVSATLRRGANTIRVEVDDPSRTDADWLRTPQGKQGWGNVPFPSPPSVYITYGGIWQPCRLVPHGPAYLTDVWCDMDPDRPIVGVDVRGACDEVEVRAFGRVVRGPAGRFELPGAELWSPERPVLHDVEVTAFADGAASHTRRIRTGLRRIEREGDDVLLNGRPYRMRSALHQGFWPRGLYLADDDLVERDIDLALGAGLNTLRTHLKAFEPSWLDAADAKGLLLQCDLPISEPLRDPALLDDPTFRRRCVIAAVEQVRRDRSRPSIIAWTLLNEVGLMDASMLDTDAYRSFVRELVDAVIALDDGRPVVENDWVFERERLVSCDVRTSHWYGRATSGFARFLDDKLAATAKESGPFYVTEFGEWGLPSSESGDAFWDNEQTLVDLVRTAGFDGTYDELAEGSQRAQGWANRVQAERLRTAPHVQGFCLTEWTDVPHELNGLVSLRREPKKAIEEFRPALADVAPIALLDRFTFARGEAVDVDVHLSNWSADDLDATSIDVVIGGSVQTLGVGPVAAGSVARAGRCSLRAVGDELVLRCGDVVASYPLHVCEPATNGRSSLAVAYGEMPDERPAVLVDPVSLPDGWPELQDVPMNWGPTPIAFTDGTLPSLGPRRVLVHELYACYPRKLLREMHGPVGVLMAPPFGRWGALVAKHDGLVVCTLRIGDAIDRGEGFALALLADLVALAKR